MGEAIRRGNFEERKTQAIEAGRVKGVPSFRQRISRASDQLGALLTPELLLGLIVSRMKNRRKSR